MDIHILNVKRLSGRRKACREALLNSGVPAENIKIFNAIDVREYATIFELCDAIAADGFPEFNILKEWYKKEGEVIQATVVMQAWSYCQFLRMAAEGEAITALIQDRRCLSISYLQLQDTIDALLALDPDFRLLSLVHNANDYPHDVLAHGAFLGSIHSHSADWFFVVSVAGAARILELFLSYIATGQYYFDQFLQTVSAHVYQPAKHMMTSLAGDFPSALHSETDAAGIPVKAAKIVDSEGNIVDN